MASTPMTDNRGVHSLSNRIEASGDQLWTVASDSNTAVRILLFPRVPSCNIVPPCKRSLSFEVWIRRGLGVAVIMGVVAIGLGWDTNLLTKFSSVNTAKAEEHLIDPAREQKPRPTPLKTA